MAGMNARVSWPLALSYAGFFLPAGVLLAYLPPFLSSKGLDAAQVGLIFSSVFLVKLIMGPALAWWADRAQRHRALMAAAAWVSVASAIGLALSRRFDVVLLSVALMAVCRNYFQCLLEALATRVKNAGGAPRYGLMRGIGSAAVCLGVVLFGGLWLAGTAYQQTVLPLMIATSGLVLIACLRCVGAAVAPDEAPPAPRAAPLTPARLGWYGASFWVLLAGATLLIGANGIFYGTASLLMASHGIDPAGIALLWCLAFGVEALGFAAFDRLRLRWGTLWLFIAAITLAVLRWWLLVHESSMLQLAVAFALHVASFSWLHAFCTHWVRDACPASHSVSAQAAYVGCGHGIGMAASAYVASRLLSPWGGGVYWIAIGMTLGGAAIVGLRAWLTVTTPSTTRSAA